MWLLALFVAVPILEIALFIQVGGWIGLWPTLAIVVATAIAGTALMRAQGLAALARLQASLAEGRDPMGPIAHGALILVAGVLLLTPGFFTDAVGLALLLPPVRAAVIRWGAARVTVIAAAELRRGGPARPGGRPAGAGPAGPRPGRGETVEAEYEVLAEDPPHEPGPAGPAGTGSTGRRANGRASAWTRPPR